MHITVVDGTRTSPAFSTVRAMHVLAVMYDTDETSLDPEEERTGVYGRRYPRPSSMYPMTRIDNEASTEELPTVTARRALRPGS